MSLKPIEKQRIAEEIAAQLRKLILTGHYALGDKLPGERQLAKDLGVNRTSLREALKTLEHIGLVKTRQGDGTRVQDFMASAGIDLLSHLIPVMVLAGPGTLLHDVLEFRCLYGREVARLAALRRTEDDLRELERVAEQTRADPQLSPEGLLAIDFEFYVAMTRATHNQVLVLLINTTRHALSAHAGPLARFLSGHAEVAAHHQQLVAAIRERDANRAAHIAERYLRASTERLIALTGGEG